jgi:hypothetical protein
MKAQSPILSLASFSEKYRKFRGILFGYNKCRKERFPRNQRIKKLKADILIKVSRSHNFRKPRRKKEKK